MGQSGHYPAAWGRWEGPGPSGGVLSVGADVMSERTTSVIPADDTRAEPQGKDSRRRG